jgi:hypothetical protein
MHAVFDGGENAGGGPLDLVPLPPIGLVLRPPLPIEMNSAETSLSVRPERTRCSIFSRRMVRALAQVPRR